MVTFHYADHLKVEKINIGQIVLPIFGDIVPIPSQTIRAGPGIRTNGTLDAEVRDMMRNKDREHQKNNG